MLSQPCLQELQDRWLPNIPDKALDRLIDLLEKGSPLLIHGSFTQTMPMGCLASHIAWNHPETAHLNYDAGVVWLNQIVGINPAGSHVIRSWDSCGRFDWPVRSSLLDVLKQHQQHRGNDEESRDAKDEDPILVEV